MEFECAWCKDAGLSDLEYTKNGVPAGSDKDGRDLCGDCVDGARTS